MSAREIYEPTADAESAMYGPFFGTLGVSAAMMFTAAGSACGTAKAGTGIASVAVTRPDLVMKAMIPVVMAGKFLRFDTFIFKKSTTFRNKFQCFFHSEELWVTLELRKVC